ncbi:hypothetical protein [Kaarinaea lacus]
MAIYYNKKLCYSFVSTSLLLAFILSGCANINTNHPALQVEADTLTANVYLIRPRMLKTKGIADNRLSVSYQGKNIAKISDGNYILLKIKPGKGEITTHSKTVFTNQSLPINVTRSRAYTFVAGRTYFIHLKRLDEEFRGVFYDPAPVDLKTAKELVTVENTRAFGAARSEPIEDIDEVPPIPKASPLDPAYPEQLYPESPYILDKPLEK